MISIIIPIYNAEKYIRRCIDSTLVQTYQDFELVLINDGSEDHSLEICKDYAVSDKRIIVITQKNNGVSSARNKGIEASHGEWITFIDADDYIDQEYIEQLYKNITDKKDTLIIQGIRKYHEGNCINKVEFENFTLADSCIQKAFDEMQIYEYGYPFAKLFNRDIVNKFNIRFNKQISYSEDLLFMLEYILHCNSISFIKGAYYNYIIQPSGLSQQYNSFESEYALFERYYSLNNAIADRFSFEPTNSSLRNGALILMRSIYSMFINKEKSRKERLEIIRNILKDKDTYIKKYYKPQIHIFKAIKMALLIHPVLFDIVCKIKFR